MAQIGMEGAVVSPQPTHAELAARMDRGNEKFVVIEKILKDICAKLEPIDQMQADIAATKEIVEAWGAVKTFARFIRLFGSVIKWVGGVAIGAAAIWAATHAKWLALLSNQP